MSRRSLPALFVFMSIAVLFCSIQATAQDEMNAGEGIQSNTPKPSTVASEVKQRLLNLIPSPAPAESVQQDATAYYVPETLYQYMDGGADIYLLYDFQTLLHEEFKAKEVDVTVDVFDMGSADNAFGMYASERSPAYEYISIGAEGYRNQGILNFLKGRYYVKLAAFGAGADSILDQFAHAIAARIDGSAEFPALLEKLPKANRKPRSEQYLLKDPLGHSFLGPAYLVSYADGKNASTLLVSVAANAEDARQRLDKLADHFRKTGKCTDAPDLAQSAIRASNSFEGNAIAVAKGKYVFVLFLKSATSEATFREALHNID